MFDGRVRRRPTTSEHVGRKHRPDYWLVVLAAILLVIGLVVVYAISPGASQSKGVSEGYYVSKQMIAIALGLVAFIALSQIPYKLWRKASYLLIFLAVIAALAVQLFGSRVNGAYRWIQVGGMSFQAAELIKFALLVWLANFLADRKSAGQLNDQQRTLKPLMIALGAILVVVAMLQSDLGSTGVMIAMMAAMVYMIGLPLKRIFMIGGIVLVALVLATTMVGYRRNRLATFLHPASDCQNTGYQSCQALIAVGSGGMFGLGLGRSVQAHGYVPEAANDSIFAILAEIFGFVGVTIIIGVYVAFFSRLARIIERAPDDFARLLVTGVLAWFSVQAFINIGAMIGLLPLKGITLPFVSYGGTSLLFVTGALGIVFQISRYTTYGSIDTLRSGEGNEDTGALRRGIGRAYHAHLGRRP